MKFRLGKLLLSGLSKRRSRPHPSRGHSRPKKRAPSRRRAIRERRETSPQLPAVVPPAPVPEGLSATALIHPNERLRSSIEGFLLDQRSPHTRRAYGKDLKRFLKFLVVYRNQRSEKIERSTIVAYKDALLTEGLEHTTVDRHLATLRSFFRWLGEDGLHPVNPAEGVRFLKPKRLSKTLGFSDEEVRRVLSKPDTHSRTGAMHQAILTTLFYAGLRRSEICALRTSNLGQERGHAVLRLRGKGDAERVVVLVPTAVDAIQHYLKIARKDPRVDQPLFSPVKNARTGVTSKPLDPSMIFYIVKKYALLAGIAHRVSPHSCRATAISNARDHHVSDRAIQEFAGWASPDMITRYDKRKTAVEGSAALSIDYG